MATPAKATSAKDFKAKAKGTTTKKVTSAKDWKAKLTEPVELPSGFVARLRRPGMEKFLSAGFLPDNLAKIVRKQINSAAGPTKNAAAKAGVEKAMEEAEMSEMVSVMDKVTAYCFEEPKVLWHKRIVTDNDGEVVWLDEAKKIEETEEIPEDERDPECVYTDEVEQEDKSFVFQYAVGGTADLAKFRAASQSVMDALAAGGSLGDTTESDTGTD